MEVSRAPSAPGFDPLGNPVPMGAAPSDTSLSYRREGSAATRNDWSAPLEWDHWLRTQPADHGAHTDSISGTKRGVRPSTGMERLSYALQNGTRTPVNIAGPGSFASLSQWQLHQTSTHKALGPAAQGFFRVQRRSTIAGSARPRSTEPKAQLGARGRMQRRVSTSNGRRTTPVPKPSWRRNRKHGGLSPLQSSRSPGSLRQSSKLPNGTTKKGVHFALCSCGTISSI